MEIIEIKGIECYYRPDTTDLRCLKEVVGGIYKNGRIGFDIEEDEVWLDLGGNIGAFALYSELKGAMCISFEPDRENFEVLKKNNPNGVNINKAFTTSKDKKLMFYKPSKDSDKYRYSTVKNSRPYLELPNFYAGDFDQHIDGIKMDIEGGEFELIEKDMLPECDKLVMEYHFSKDRSFVNFYERISLLKKKFKNVYYMPSIDKWYEKGLKEYPVWIDRIIYCWK